MRHAASSQIADGVETLQQDPTTTRRKTSPQQVAEWRRLIEEQGWTIKSVAAKDHVQARTVRLALDRDDARQDFRAVQRERLRAAVEAHDRDLLTEADRLRRALTWPPFSLVPHESLTRKRHRALVGHVKRLGLQASLNRWEALVRRHDRTVASLDQALRTAVWTGGFLDAEAVKRLMAAAEALVKDWPPTTLGYAVRGRALMDGAYEILSNVESLDDPRAKRARDEIEGLAEALGNRDEIKELRALHQEWDRLQARLVGAMEDVTLRQLPPGRCDWCPGESRAGGA